MEQNLPIVAKRVWSMVRVVYFMLRKTISKKKLLLDLNFMTKRGKIAGKAVSSLAAFFHHRHSHGGGASRPGYEFSCSDRPAFPKLVNAVLEMLNKNEEEEEGVGASPALPKKPRVRRVRVTDSPFPAKEEEEEVGASPALPKKPRVRRVRVTDSPFPAKEAEEESGVVDKAAEEFIRKFYTQLKNQ